MICPKPELILSVISIIIFIFVVLMLIMISLISLFATCMPCPLVYWYCVGVAAVATVVCWFFWTSFEKTAFLLSLAIRGEVMVLITR